MGRSRGSDFHCPVPAIHVVAGAVQLAALQMNEDAMVHGRLQVHWQVLEA